MDPMTRQQPGWLLRLSTERVDAAIRAREDLRDYQVDKLIPFLIATPKSAAYVEMGLGKTISLLTVLDALFTRNLVRKVLIIAPKRVAVQTWPTEITDWRHVTWMTHSLIQADGGSGRKAAAAVAPQSVHIINREQVVWLVNFHRRQGRWPYDCIIVDESTSFADHKTKRWKALASVAHHTKRVHLLSGTPAPEGIMDLFAQIYLLDGGKRFGRGVTAFRQKYMMQNPYTLRWGPQLGAMEKVTDLISDICMVMREEDYLDLEKPLVIERPIILDADEMKQYKAFERDLILSIGEGVEIEAVNSGVLSMKLLQYASGAVYDSYKVVHPIHDHKIEEMHEIVEENPGQPLLVAYWFKSSLARLRVAFPKATVMDKDGACVAAWNAGKIPMLLVHPASAGHGLNMQLGPGHILIFVDTPASLELYLQMVKRIARPGQKKPVKVIHLVTRGTIEALAVPKLVAKESAQMAITDRLRALREEINAEEL